MSDEVWARLEREVKTARARVRKKTRKQEQWFGGSFGEAGHNVRELLALRGVVDELIDDETIRAREEGTSWDRLGSSRQQAQQRHKRAMTRRSSSTAVDGKAHAADAIRQQPLTSRETV